MRDLCPEIDLVVHALRTEGQGEVATRVVEVVAAGATGGEILMGVRHELTQLLHTGLAPELQAQVNDVVAHIDRVLDPARQTRSRHSRPS
ncbi:hypothetical protein EII35_15330 [Arachnia propionica]|uniref:Uncharacterized protein n=1 Tax=Arachnia propionica TaxID=1750 RepID=A0A3P1WLJ0_9ACTN|nr:hypothetical protein EII35_15330 [Arachnia propionica]